MTVIRILETIRDAGENAWNACAAGELEDYNYLLATEAAGLPGFLFLYVTAWRNGELLAALPAFLTDYALDTTMDGAGRKIAGAVASVLPHLMTMKLACIGSPVTEYGEAFFHPVIADPEKPAILRAMIQAFEAEAVRRRHSLIGLKDTRGADQKIWDAVLTPMGYKAVPGMPVATLDINFRSLDEYLERLSSGTRKDMRRKLRCLNQIRVERRTETIDDVLPRLMELYRQTRARAEMQFEDLTPAFFRDVLRLMPGRASFALYFAGDELLGANLLLQDKETLLDKFFVMDADRGRDYNLYFLSWFINVDYCLDHGLKFYQSGAAAYENKQRLGSRLLPTSMYFRHRNVLIQGALRLVAPLLADDTMKEVA